MSSNRRHWPRRALEYRAIIVGGGTRIRCTVLDASVGGARLAFAGAAGTPDELTLCLSPAGGPCRGVRVVWRGEDEIGVAWTTHISKAMCEDGHCGVRCPPPDDLPGEADCGPASDDQSRASATTGSISEAL